MRAPEQPLKRAVEPLHAERLSLVLSQTSCAIWEGDCALS
jgi:hypothetical protein